MKATQVQYIFLGTTVIALVYGVMQMTAKNKAISAIQTATALPTLQALYPVTAK